MFGTISAKWFTYMSILDVALQVIIFMFYEHLFNAEIVRNSEKIPPDKHLFAVVGRGSKSRRA